MYRILLLILNIIIWVNFQSMAQSNSIKALKPKSFELQGWKETGSSYFSANNLTDLFKQEAKYYQEFGFSEALSVKYNNSDAHKMQIDIICMKDAAAAYGIFSFYRNVSNQTMNIGQGSLKSDYYLFFWKDKYFIKLSSEQKEENIQISMIYLARLIDLRIKNKGNLPEISLVLPRGNLSEQGVAFLRGNLALSRSYPFDERNIFKLNSGAVGHYKDYKIFTFQYQSVTSCSQTFNDVLLKLKTNNRFGNFSGQGDKFVMYDQQNNRITINKYKKYILISIGPANIDLSNDIKLVRRNIDKLL